MRAQDADNERGESACAARPSFDLCARARVGDRLIVDGDHRRTCVVIAVPQADGSPPYVVKWLANGHIAMVSPDQYTILVPDGHPAGTSIRQDAS